MRNFKIVGSGRLAGRVFYAEPVGTDPNHSSAILLKLDEAALAPHFKGQVFAFNVESGALCIKNDQCDLLQIDTFDLPRVGELFELYQVETVRKAS